MAGHVRGKTLRVPLDIAANHVAASALELAAWWLENDMPYPPEEMGRIYQRLIVEATWHAVLPHDGRDGAHSAAAVASLIQWLESLLWQA